MRERDSSGGRPEFGARSTSDLESGGDRRWCNSSWPPLEATRTPSFRFLTATCRR
ncbi:hypothetical protein ACFPRL_24170 [Pseudoclavibacter helvolus]